MPWHSKTPVGDTGTQPSARKSRSTNGPIVLASSSASSASDSRMSNALHSHLVGLCHSQTALPLHPPWGLCASTLAPASCVMLPSIDMVGYHALARQVLDFWETGRELRTCAGVGKDAHSLHQWAGYKARTFRRNPNEVLGDGQQAPKVSWIGWKTNGCSVTEHGHEEHLLREHWHYGNLREPEQETS